MHMKTLTTQPHATTVLKRATAIADGRAGTNTDLHVKSPLSAFTLALGGAMLTLATGHVDASWRIEQLRDDNGRSYYGWCNDETCPRPSVLRPPQPPAPLPEPVTPPAVNLNDALPLPGLSMREPTVFPRGPTPPMSSAEERKAAAQARTASKEPSSGTRQIKRLPETKNGRPIPPSKRGRPSSLDEIEEARREAMRRSAQRSPVPGKFLAPGAAPGTPDAPSGKRQIILNPGVQSAVPSIEEVAAQPVQFQPPANSPLRVNAPVAQVNTPNQANLLPAFQRLQPTSAGAPAGYLSGGRFFPASEVNNTGNISFEREVQPAKQLIGQTNKVTIVLNPGVQ